MDGEKNKKSRLAFTTLAIAIMATLLVTATGGGMATYAQSKETNTSTTAPPAEGQSQPDIHPAEPSVLPAPPTESEEDNCGDVTARDFAVDATTNNTNFDLDGDGTACESQPEAGGSGGGLTETEVIITGDELENLEEQNPDVAQAIEDAAESIANQTNSSAASDIVNDIAEEVAANDSGVAAELPEALNETSIIEGVGEIIILDEILEGQGVNVTESTENITEALEGVDITVDEVQEAVDTVTEEGTIQEEVNVAPPAEGEPASPVIEAGAEEAAEEAAGEIAQGTGQNEETVRQLLERALQILG